MSADPVGRSSEPAAPSRTVLGVAIAIPDPLGALLTQWRIKVGDPLAQLIPPHVTLLPPTDVSDIPADDVRKHLEAVGKRHAPFQLHLTGTGSFRPVSQVVFVAVAEGISSCEILAADIRSKLLFHPLDYPYHPHVTIAHDVPPDMLDLAYGGLADVDTRVDVDSFYAFARDPSGRWLPSDRYELRGPS